MARKKRKTERRWVKPTPSVPAKFAVGDRVRVKPGTLDPDFMDIPLSGWVGVILEQDRRSDPPTILIEWDRRTLDHMHPVYLARCMRDDLDSSAMWLGEEDVDLDVDEPAVLEQPTSIINRPLRLNDPGDRVRAIFGLTSNDPLPPSNEQNLRHYHSYLSAKLSFPMRATTLAAVGLSKDAVVPLTLVRLLDPDEDEGLMCEAVQEGEIVALPLAELEIISSKQDRRLSSDYIYWFNNAHPDRSAQTASAALTPSEADARRADAWSSLKALGLFFLCSAGAGAALGALFMTIEGATTGALVGAAILGCLGGAMGATYRAPVEGLDRAWLGLVFGGVLGAAAGGLVGAMVVAFIGTLTGGVVGALIAKLLKRGAAGLFVGALLGAGVGGVALAFYRQTHGEAWVGLLHGMWIAAVAAMLALAGWSGLQYFAGSRQKRE